MKSIFKLGQNSLEVTQSIVRNHPQIKKLLLVSHEVGVNWRQKNTSLTQKKKNLLASFTHYNNLYELNLTRNEFLALTLISLPKLQPHQVWSITSKVECKGNNIRHIPMMNFHPEGVLKEFIVKCIKHICKNKRGVFLDSGRFYHYYGNFLIDEKDWVKFLAEFLMPTMVVSPRYIGHQLHYGYCKLRLTADIKYKTKIPKVTQIL
jgi:hypothetical protein